MSIRAESPTDDEPAPMEIVETDDTAAGNTPDTTAATDKSKDSSADIEIMEDSCEEVIVDGDGVSNNKRKNYEYQVILMLSKYFPFVKKCKKNYVILML